MPRLIGSADDERDDPDERDFEPGVDRLRRRKKERAAAARRLRRYGRTDAERAARPAQTTGRLRQTGRRTPARGRAGVTTRAARGSGGRTTGRLSR
jgi:hypothetical protein